MSFSNILLPNIKRITISTVNTYLDDMTHTVHIKIIGIPDEE